MAVAQTPAHLPRITPGSTQLNAVWNSSSFFVAVVLAFLVTPITIRTIGDARYGVLALAAEFTAYYGLLDFGARAAVTYYVSRLVAEDAAAELDELLRTAFWNLATLAVVIISLVAAIMWGAPELLRIQQVPVREAQLSFGLLLGAFALTLPLSIPNAVYVGFRRFDVSNMAVIAANIVIAIGTVVILKSGGGLVEISALQASRVLLVWAGQVFWLRRLGFHLPFGRPQLRSRYTKGLYTYGSANLAITVASLIGYSLDLVIVGRILGLVDVSRFHIGRYLGMHLQNLTGTMSATLATVFTYHTTRGDTTAAQGLYIQASRLLGAITLIACSGIFVFGQSFLRLWVGEKYVTGPWWGRSDAVLMFMTSASLAGSMALVSYQYMLATRKLRVLTWVRVAEAVTNVMGSVAGAFFLGLAGIALSRVVVVVLGSSVLLLYTLSLIGVSRRTYVKRIAFPVIVVGAATAAAGTMMQFLLPPRAWQTLFVDSIVSGAAGVIALWFFVLDAGQRDDYLGKARALVRRGAA